MRTTTKRNTGNRTTNANRFGTWASTSTRTTAGRARTTATTPTGTYKNVCNTFTNKISSYRTLINQTKGPAKFPRPTPNTLNSFANWINKGAVIQTCSPAQLAKWARNTNMNFNPRTPSVTACKNILNKKFGKNCIKAVARTKNGQFMVATTPTVNGKNFQLAH